MVQHANLKTLSAIVLSGGQSRRMRRVDKGLMNLGGKPMISYVLNRLRQHVSDISISTNNNHAYALFGYPMVNDVMANNVGPLAGIHAGLCAATTQRILIVPCDCPFLDTALCVRLINAMDAQSSLIAVAHDGEHLQTTFAVIDNTLKDSLRDYLNRGGRRLITWFKEQNAIEVDYSDCKESFVNINTIDDIENAENTLRK